MQMNDYKYEHYALLFKWLRIMFFTIAFYSIASNSYAQTPKPGGVSANLRVWLRAETGFSPSLWNDQSGLNNNYLQTFANRQPVLVAASKSTNFNRAVDFGDNSDAGYKFMNIPTGKPFSAKVLPGTLFLVNNLHAVHGSGWRTPVSFGYEATTDYAPHYSDLPALTIYPTTTYHALYWYNNYGWTPPMNTASQSLVTGIPSVVDASWLSSGTVALKYGRDGLLSQSTAVTMNPAYISLNTGGLIGSQATEHGNMDISEFIAFERELTPAEKERVRSYLAIKYGTTLLNNSNYYASNGTIVWDGDITIADQAYNNNIFGIARENASALHQKISNSVNGGTILTVANSNDFSSANAASTRPAIATDMSFLMFGDNNNTSTTLTNITNSDCPAIDPNANAKKIARTWLVQSTGTPGSAFLNVSLTSYAINTKVFMLVADDAAFTQNVQKISGTIKNGIATFNYTFKAKQYMTFGGEFGAAVCQACEEGAFRIKTAYEWWNNRCCGIGAGNAWATNVVGPYSPGSVTNSGASTAVTAKLEILDPGGVEWAGNVRPWAYGYDWLWLRRHSSSSVMTYRVTLNEKAKARFEVGGINAYYGSDNVVIKGYCNNSTTVIKPKLVRKSGTYYPSFTVNGNLASGDKYWGEGGELGTVRVEFDQPVEKIDIEWVYNGAPNYWYTSDLFISDMVFECPALLPPNADGLHVEQDYTSNEIPSCKDGEIRFRFTNENCDPRTINLSNTLPAGVTYVANSYKGGELPSGSITPVYTGGGSTFTFTGLSVPAGITDVYVKVKAAAAGTYNSQGDYMVISTNNAYKTIGDSNTGVAGDNAVLTVKASTPVVKPDTMTMSVNKSCFVVGDTLTYTVSFNNTKGVTIPKVKFENFVDSTNVKILGGSLSTTFGGIANSYAGSGYLTIDDMTLPTGGSSLTYKVVVLAAATDTLANQASIMVDPTSECGGESAALRTEPLYLLKCTDCAKPTSVGINGSSSQTQQFCANSTITLQATCPSGTTPTWYKMGTPNVKLGTGSPFTQTLTETTTYGASCEKDGCVPVFDNTNKIMAAVQPIVAAPTNNVSSAGTTAICVGASTTLSATCAAGTTVVWYIGAAVATTGSPVTVSPTTTTTYTAKCKSTATACESASTSANDVVVTVNPVVAVPTGISSSKGTAGICVGDSTSLSATCASGSTTVWYIGTAVAGTGSPLVVKPTSTTTYTAKCKSTATACESASTSAEDISVTVLPVVANPTGISSSAGTTICAGTSTDISATCASGSTVVWYSASALIATGSPLSISPAANITYTAKCKSSATSCESSVTSANDLAIIVTPIPAAPSSVSSGSSTICPNGSTTLTGTCTTGTIQWYIGTVSVGSGSPLAVAPLATTTYSATCKSAVGTCESAKTATSDVTVTVANPAAPTGIGSSAGNTLCTTNTATNLTATCAAGSTLQWYIGTVSVGSGSPLAVQPMATTTYTATCKSGTGTCESPSTASSQITLTVDPCPVTPPIITSNPTTPVAGQATTFSATGCTIGVISWYKNGVLIAGSTSSTYGPILVEGGDKYTSKCTVNGTTSPPSNEIAVIPTATVVTPNPSPIVPNQPVTFTAAGCTNGVISWYKNNVLIAGATGSTYGPVTAVTGDSYTSVCTVNGLPSSPSTPIVVPVVTDGLLNVKALLQGPLSGTIMTTTLNTKNLIPTTDPYGKGATTSSAILTANSITDWVLVELRSAPGAVTESIVALVKNDGTIVNADGTSPLKFVTTSGNFYVSVRHRNHLGVMTANTVAISNTAQAIDFTNAATATFGTNAQKTVGTVKAMWAGNATGVTLLGTDKVIYAGSTNDVSSVRLIALSVGTLGTSSIVAGYRNSDLNLDGNTIYAGSNTDTALIRNTVLSYPFSGTSPGTAGIVNQSF